MSRSCRSPPRTTCARPTRSACSRCRWSRWPASTPRRAPPAARPSSATRRATSSAGRPLVARSLRASGVRAGMKVHNAYGYGLFTGGLGAHAGIEALGATVIPMSGGQTARQVQLIQDFEPDVDPLHARATCSRSPTRWWPPGIDPRSHQPQGRPCSAPNRGPTRCAHELERPPRHRRARHLRAQRGDGPRRRQRVPRDQGRPAHLGGPLPAGDHRRRHRRAPARRRDAASSSSPR